MWTSGPCIILSMRPRVLVLFVFAKTIQTAIDEVSAGRVVCYRCSFGNTFLMVLLELWACKTHYHVNLRRERRLGIKGIHSVISGL